MRNLTKARRNVSGLSETIPAYVLNINMYQSVLAEWMVSLVIRQTGFNRLHPKRHRYRPNCGLASKPASLPTELRSCIQSGIATDRTAVLHPNRHRYRLSYRSSVGIDATLDAKRYRDRSPRSAYSFEKIWS